jgi:Spy/CpxP family protein refolding chaperone
MSRIALTLVAALGAATVLAQGGPAAGADRPARTEAFKLVDAYVVSNLQESLGLTDEQFAKAIPLVKKLQTERREYYLERARKVREMRGLLHEGGATEAQVLDLLRQLKALDAEGPEQVRKNLAALDAVLSPIQQAKFRVLEADVEQRMRELMSRARQRGPRPGAREPRE